LHNNNTTQRTIHHQGKAIPAARRTLSSLRSDRPCSVNTRYDLGLARMSPALATFVRPSRPSLVHSTTLNFPKKTNQAQSIATHTHTHTKIGDFTTGVHRYDRMNWGINPISERQNGHCRTEIARLKPESHDNARVDREEAIPASVWSARSAYSQPRNKCDDHSRRQSRSQQTNINLLTE